MGSLIVVVSLTTPCLSGAGAPRLFKRFSTDGGSGGASFGTGTIMGEVERFGAGDSGVFDSPDFDAATGVFGGGKMVVSFGNFEKSSLEISGATGFGATGASSGIATAGVAGFAGAGMAGISGMLLLGAGAGAAGVIFGILTSGSAAGTGTGAGAGAAFSTGVSLGISAFTGAATGAGFLVFLGAGAVTGTLTGGLALGTGGEAAIGTAGDGAA